MRATSPKVFISYGRVDSGVAKRLADNLREVGVDPWLDVERLEAGQLWEDEIQKAILEADFVLALLSSRSLGKRGYAQKELRQALDVLDEVPEGQIFLIPVRLDECEPAHKKLKEIQWVDLFPSYELGLEKVIRSIRPPQISGTGAFDSSFVVDPTALDQAGWGVIFTDKADPAIRAALAPLLELRRSQAGRRDERLYKEFSGASAYVGTESVPEFLARQGMAPGIPDPRRVPQYLLIVGKPDEIPFSFQSYLGIQYRVGRLAFDHPEEYANYSQSVIDFESGRVELSRQATMFNVTHPHDRATHLTLQSLTDPLTESLSRQLPSWSYNRVSGEKADKNALRAVFAARPRQNFVFLVAHGIYLANTDPRASSHHGAPVCAEWGGNDPKIDVENHCFHAADVDSTWDLRGLVLWMYTEFGAGTSGSLEAQRQIPSVERESPRPASVSALPQRLLGRRNGALAIVGQVDHAWTTSFAWPGVGPQTQTFEAALQSILRGDPVGMSLQYFSSRYAELAAHHLQRHNPGAPLNKVDKWIEFAMYDARNRILLGDPAVALKSRTASRAAG